MHHLHLHAVRARQRESRSPDRPLRVLRELPSCRGPKMEQLEAHDQEARGHRRASHEADRVPTAVAGRLGRVPGQVQVTHRSSVCTLYAQRGFSRVQFNAYRSAAAASNKSARSEPAIARLSDVPRVQFALDVQNGAAPITELCTAYGILRSTVCPRASARPTECPSPRRRSGGSPPSLQRAERCGRARHAPRRRVPGSRPNWPPSIRRPPGADGCSAGHAHHARRLPLAMATNG